MAADVSGFLSMMPPMKGERIAPVMWSDGMTKACLGVLENPKENVVAIIANFADTDEGKDYRARYLLRGVVTVAAAPENKEKLDAVVEAVASGLAGDRNKEVKMALLRELRFAGTAAAAKAIAACLTDEVMVADAATALVNIQAGATALLVAALPKASAKCKIEIIHALAALAEPEGLAAMQAAIADPELYTRIAAARGVARCADAGSVDTLLKASDAAKDWERYQLTDSCLILAERLIAAGKKAEGQSIYTSLKDSRKDPREAYIVELSKKALAG